MTRSATCSRKPAIVADDEKRRRLGREHLFEPEDAVEIEVIRRLVEKQSSGRIDERAGDGESLLPSTGERRGVTSGSAEAPIARASIEREPFRALHRRAGRRAPPRESPPRIDPAETAGAAVRRRGERVPEADDASVGSSIRASTRTSVDLPLPLGPTSRSDRPFDRERQIAKSGWSRSALEIFWQPSRGASLHFLRSGGSH